MKKILKTIIKIVGILLLVVLIIAFCVYKFVLQYPDLKENPTVGKWYRITTSEMKDSEGGKYRAFFKKGIAESAGTKVEVVVAEGQDHGFKQKYYMSDFLEFWVMLCGDC